VNERTNIHQALRSPPAATDVPPVMRTQLSLFVPLPAAATLEAVRRLVDPVQAALIPAHVTLCREADMTGATSTLLQTRLATESTAQLTLHFGAAVRSEAHGLLLPCVAGAAAFTALRRVVLGPEAARVESPHLTLAHPRNPRAPGNDIDATRLIPTPLEISFGEIHWIEQATPGQPWRIRHTYPLGRVRADANESAAPPDARRKAWGGDPGADP
jgi:hypothetical protein